MILAKIERWGSDSSGEKTTNVAEASVAHLAVTGRKTSLRPPLTARHLADWLRDAVGIVPARWDDREGGYHVNLEAGRSVQ